MSVSRQSIITVLYGASANSSPIDLYDGEFAFANGSGKLFIGSGGNNTPIWVGSLIEDADTIDWYGVNAENNKLATQLAILNIFSSGAISDIQLSGSIIFEGSTDDEYETEIAAIDPTADRTIYIPDASGTLAIISGSDTQVLFNDGGYLLSGDSGLTYNKTTDTLTISGDLAVNGGDITTTSTGTFYLANANATGIYIGTVAATDVRVGKSDSTGTNRLYGTTNIVGGTLDTSAATSYLFNTTATTLSIGGASSLLTVGYGSNLSSTTNISNGAVGSGNTKTVNIGTGGAAGSTTNVNIGSSNGGSTTISSPNSVVSGDLAVNGGDITTTSSTSTIFNSGSVNVSLGGDATTLTLGATSGNAFIRNPSIVVGNTTGSITTNSGTTNNLNISPYGNLILNPSANPSGEGSTPSLTIENSSSASGLVQVSGGDLYLGVKTADDISFSSVNIIFEGSTANGYETTITAANPSADRTITFPDLTGTVGLVPGSDTQVVYNNAGALGANSLFTYDSTTNTLLVDGGHVKANFLGAVQIEVRNTTGSPISSGTPVYAVGYSGNRILISPADASDSSKMPAVGIVEDAISHNSNGHATVLGVLRNINTSSYTINQTMYVASGGGLTNIRPTSASVLVQNMGKVVNVGHNGEIVVFGPGRTNDVPNQITVNDTIVFEGATANDYETTLAVTDPTADRTITFPDSTGTVALVAGSDTQVMFNDGGSSLGGDSGLIYNKTTDTLTVSGDLAVNGGDITTTSTGTATLFNTAATTLNIGGAATSVNIGSSTAISTFGNIFISSNAREISVDDNYTLTLAAPGTADPSRILLTGNGDVTFESAIDVFTFTGSGQGSSSVTLEMPATTTIGDSANTSSTFNVSTSATASGNTKTVNLGTGAASGSTTNIGVGSSNGGTTTINSPNTVVSGDLAVNGADITTTSTGTATLFNTNATTLNVGGVATAITMGDSTTATTTIRGGTLVGNTTTQNLFNTTATTLNLGGAATTVSLGAATGTTTINNANTVVTGDLAVNGGDITSSATTFNLLNSTVTSLNIGGAATTGTFGYSSTATSATNISTGAVAASNIKTVNIGTGGAASSTTNINIGSNAGGTTTINSATVVGSASTQNVFNTVATTLNIGGAATSMNIGSTTGFTTISSPYIYLSSGSNSALVQTPGTGNLSLMTGGSSINGSNASITITSTGDGAGEVRVEGGDLYLGIKQDANPTSYPVNIVFEGATSDGFETTLTVVNPTADQTITLPNATGTVALVAGSDTQVLFNDGGSAVGGDSGLTYNKTTDALTVSGDIAVNGGDMTSSAATFNLLNSSTTTINMGGSATSIVIGATTGTTEIRNNLQLNAQSDIRFADSDSSNYIAFQAPATVSNNNIYTLPSSVGTTNQVLSIASVSGNDATLQWSTAGGASVGGSDTYVQFNDGGSALGGDSGLTYNKLNDTLTIGSGSKNLQLYSESAGGRVSVPGNAATELVLQAGTNGVGTVKIGDHANDSNGTKIILSDSAQTIGIQGTFSITSPDGSYTNTFPTDSGTSGQVLSTNGSGNLSWSSSYQSFAIAMAIAL